MTSVVNALTVSLPIVFSNDEAAQVAERLLYRPWIERVAYDLALPIEYSELDAGDVITVIVNSVTHIIRVSTISLSTPGLVLLQGVAEYAAVYSSAAIGGSGNAGNQVVSADGPTHIEMLDIPALRDSEASSVGFYVAACGYLPSWSAGVLYKSLDGGDTYSNYTALTRAASIGVSTGALPDADPAQWDMPNSITVNMINGTLSSDTVINVLNGANAGLLGSEVIQWTTATLNANGSYTLTGLLRGRRGTEWATSSHIAGDRFIVLSPSMLFWIAHPTSELNQQRDYKAVTVGRTLQDTSKKSFTGTGVNLKPYAPVEVAGSRDGSNNLTITWSRRSRYSAAMLWSPVLGEDVEAYEVDIMDGAAVLRTISSSSESAGYSAANQTSDGLTAGNPVEVNIYQLSATVGRGYAGNQIV